MNKDVTAVERRLLLTCIWYFSRDTEELFSSLQALKSQAEKETFNGFDNKQLEKIETCLEIAKGYLHNLKESRIRQ